MKAEAFQQAISEWIRDVQDEAIRLFDNGCQPSDCLRIAIQCADSRANMRTLRMQALTGRTGAVVVPRPPS